MIIGFDSAPVTDPTIREVDGGIVFAAKVVPGSSKTNICGLLNGALKIKVAAPPEKGKANKCLLQFLAKQLGVKRNAIAIISGQTSQLKQVQVLGLSRRQVVDRLDLNI